MLVIVDDGDDLGYARIERTDEKKVLGDNLLNRNGSFLKFH